jgi:hypothetical protein
MRAGHRFIIECLGVANEALHQAQLTAQHLGDAELAALCHERSIEVVRMIGKIVKEEIEIKHAQERPS